eukprot:scaffold39849_cov56-Phaeocystis_antarctica.AAC.4
MPVGGGDVRAAVWSRLHSRRGCRQRACHPQRRGRHRVRDRSGLGSIWAKSLLKPKNPVLRLAITR